MYCSECGEELLDKAVICPECGCETKNYKKLNVEKYKLNEFTTFFSFVAAAILPLLGGILFIYFIFTHRILHAILLGSFSAYMSYFWFEVWKYPEFYPRVVKFVQFILP